MYVGRALIRTISKPTREHAECDEKSWFFKDFAQYDGACPHLMYMPVGALVAMYIYTDYVFVRH